MVAELVPSVNLLKEVKDRGIAFTLRSIYEDEKFEPLDKKEDADQIGIDDLLANLPE